ncbi:DUF2742 domain-containing protein [Streptomyces sp. NPDC005486]|uniref:DUF2742 domain-containing protein n=1 Tax=Streptomyces sp. NPDC005486 TaxID=3155345 RepID=UPI0033B5A332
MSTHAIREDPRPLGRGPRLRIVPNDPTAGEITHLRACAQATDLLPGEDATWPAYGSPAWLQLDPQDPRALVATLEAAELHRMAEERRYADSYQQAIEVRHTAAADRAVRRKTMRTRQSHKITPTPGWPPIQIPGRPGEYLTLENRA